MSDYRNLFFSKEQYWVDSSTDFIKKIPQLVNLINKSSGVDFDWSDEFNTNNLSEGQLINIQNSVSGDIQTDLVSILSPYIEPHLNNLFGKRLKFDIRVGAQAKGRWDEKEVQKNRKGKMIDGVFFEDENRPNLAFPTRPHQDLDNNGNRSSHTMIFYFSLTPSFENASLMEHACFKKKVGLLPFSSNNNYSNEIPLETSENLSWNIKGLDPGDISLMSAYTIHRSSLLAEIPRIALNVKIQPTNLDYLEHIYDLDLSSCRQGVDLNRKLINLHQILGEGCEKNRGLLFEKGIVSLLLGNIDQMKKEFEDLCLFNVTEDQIFRMALGGILRKLTLHVKESEKAYLDKPSLNIVPLSCAAAIMETLHEPLPDKVF
jgi:hypothetical protein